MVLLMDHLLKDLLMDHLLMRMLFKTVLSIGTNVSKFKKIIVLQNSFDIFCGVKIFVYFYL